MNLPSLCIPKKNMCTWKKVMIFELSRETVFIRLGKFSTLFKCLKSSFFCIQLPLPPVWTYPFADWFGIFFESDLFLKIRTSLYFDCRYSGFT